MESHSKDEESASINSRESENRRNKLTKPVIELINLFRDWVKINAP